MSFKKVRYIVRLTALVFLLGAFEGCSRDEETSLTLPKGNDVFIVDAQHEKSMDTTCGTPDAACATLADALISAAKSKSANPLIWVKSGAYVLNSAAPLEITMPMTLQVEQGQKAVIRSKSTVLSISSSGVIIEGFHIISNGAGEIPTVVVNGGKVTFKRSRITNNGPETCKGIGLLIQNGGHVSFEKSRVETNGSLGIEAMEGKINIQQSTVRAGSYAVVVSKDGRATFENSAFEGKISTDGGSMSIDNCQTEDIRIADGAYATLTGNTIHGLVSVLRNQAYANLAGNTIHGLHAYSNSTIDMSQNEFDAATAENPAIKCDRAVIIKSDGTNSFKTPESTIACGELPSTPGLNSF